jgi:hypothetical protein
VPEGEPVMAGMFLVNQHLAIVLFDSESSHSFVSQAFAQKHNQEISNLDYGYHICLAGVDISTRQMVHVVTIEIGNREFLMNLIVLHGLGLYVIMGMNWMQRWGVIIDTTNRTLTLSEPQGGGTFQVLLPRGPDLLECIICYSS